RFNPGEVALETVNLSLAGGSVRGVSIQVRRGEIVGLAGLVGCGKSEVARACFGIERIAGGQVRFFGEDATGISPRRMLDRGFFYLPSDRREVGLVMQRGAGENMILPALHIDAFSGPVLLRRRREREKAQELARGLNLQPLDVERPVAHFSGGNQQKVLLAKALSREVKLFVFDEP